MQHTLSSSLKVVEHENLCPDSIWMNLEGVPSGSSEDGAEASILDLALTIRLGKQWVSVANGRVQFGLTGAELILKLDRGILLDPLTQFNPPPDSTVTISPQHPDSSQASWRFHVQSSLILNGELCQIKLGTVRLLDPPCRIEAMVAIAPQDLRLTDAEGLWRPDIHPNQYAVIERKLAFTLWQHQFNPFISWMQICYQCPDPCMSLMDRYPPIDRPHGDLELAILKMTQAQTTDFLELAQQVGLNPAYDFAGGALRGTTLRGCDLSNADLRCANFRGADLSDAELSEVNLDRTILSGADLSGADLGNATLRYADLHRASLALANLSGANLESANLIRANLSHTNLNGTTVKNARFGHNPGLTDALKGSLQQQGAIFEE
jgi:hypothetical protein